LSSTKSSNHPELPALQAVPYLSTGTQGELQLAVGAINKRASQSTATIKLEYKI